MTFRVIRQPSTNRARCPYRIVVRETGREIDWINRYLDYETLRRLADNTLKSYAHELLLDLPPRLRQTVKTLFPFDDKSFRPIGQ